MTTPDGWTRYEVHVLEELKRLSASTDRIEGEIVVIHEEVASLRVKSGVWGAIAGLIPAAGILLYVALR